jgi:hypothetical protein
LQLLLETKKVYDKRQTGEVKMKKAASIFFCLLFFVSFTSVAFAGKRIVQLHIPGCAS